MSLVTAEEARRKVEAVRRKQELDMAIARARERTEAENRLRIAQSNFQLELDVDKCEYVNDIKRAIQDGRRDASIVIRHPDADVASVQRTLLVSYLIERKYSVLCGSGGYAEPHTDAPGGDYHWYAIDVKW